MSKERIENSKSMYGSFSPGAVVRGIIKFIHLFPRQRKHSGKVLNLSRAM